MIGQLIPLLHIGGIQGRVGKAQGFAVIHHIAIHNHFSFCVLICPVHDWLMMGMGTRDTS
jgi:hypothetical protein